MSDLILNHNVSIKAPLLSLALKLMTAAIVIAVCFYIGNLPHQDIGHHYLSVENFGTGICLGAIVWFALLVSGNIALGIFVLVAPIIGFILFHDFKQLRALGLLLMASNAIACSFFVADKLDISLMVGTLTAPILLLAMIFSVVIGEFKYILRSVFGIGAENEK